MNRAEKRRMYKQLNDPAKMRVVLNNIAKAQEAEKVRASVNWVGYLAIVLVVTIVLICLFA